MVNENGMRTMLGVADPWVLKGDLKKRVEFYEDHRRIYCVDETPEGGRKAFQPPPATPSPIPLIKPKSKKKVARDLKVFYKQKVSPNQFRSFPEAKQYPRKLLHYPIKWRCEAKPKKIVKPLETTLGSPVGLANSSFSMRIIQKKKHNYKLQGLATCIIAYGQHFITPEDEWDTTLINNVLMEGRKLYERSYEENDNNADNTNSTHFDSDGDSVSYDEPEGENKRKILDIPENQLQRVFKLCGTSIQFDMSDVIAFGLIGSKTIDCDHRIPLLEYELKHFFQTYETSALIKVNGWHIIVWKCDGVYFVFDCYGRNIQNLSSNRTREGVATLLCLRELDNVVHLFTNLSDFNANDFFSLRLVKIVQLLPCGELPLKLAVKQLRQNDYQIIDDDYAILCGTKNFGPFCHFGKLYRHSLVVALSALLYSKCDPPASWTSRIIDQIFCIGNALYKKWSKSIPDCDHSIDFNIKDIPSHIVFGQFVIHITILERKYVGLWECTPNYHQSDLYQKIMTAFREGHQNLIVTIHKTHYAIWKKGDFYYFFDPNKHTGCMDIYPTNKTRKLTSSIQLRICRNLNVLMCVFTQVIMNMHLSCNFQIDVVRVIEIQRYHPDYVEDWCVKESDDCSNRTEPESLSESVEWKPADLEFNEFSDQEAGDDNGGGDGGDDDDLGLKKSPSTLPQTAVVVTQDDKKTPEFGAADEEEKGFYDKFNLDSPGNSDAELELIDDHAIEKFVKICDTFERALCGCDDDDGGDGDASGLPEIDEILIEEEEVAAGGGDESKDKGDGGDDGDKGPGGGGGRGGRGRGDNDDDGGGRGGGGGGKEKGGSSKGGGGSKGKTNADGYNPNDNDSCGCNSDVYPDTDHYPGVLSEPRDLVVVGSETGNYNSLCKLITVGFNCTDRILLMTPWRNFALFQATASFESYFVFDGCTCQVEKFRYLDLRCGTAGFLHFKEIHALIEYLRNSRKNSCGNEKRKLLNIDGICATYCDNSCS